MPSISIEIRTKTGNQAQDAYSHLKEAEEDNKLAEVDKRHRPIEQVAHKWVGWTHAQDLKY